jgi:protein-S-isoprenylcysteine O-methyltransferase Ste14
VAVAAICLFATLAACTTLRLSAGVTIACGLAAWIFAAAAFDLLVLKVHLRPSTGLDPSLLRHRLHLPRLGVKMLGLLITAIALACAYALSLPLIDPLVPQFGNFFRSIARFLPLILALCIAYVVIIDGMLKRPEDGIFEVGQLALLNFRGRDWRAITDYAFNWTIKGYFLPLMGGTLLANGRRFANAMPSDALAGPVELVTWVTGVLLVVDLVIVVSGYALTLRLLDTHIRTPMKSLLGWAVCLLCYAPFNLTMLRTLMTYNDGLTWGDWFAGIGWLAHMWAAALLFLYGIWIWTNLSFGLRFSNLTNRGIITNGPFRYVKHPAYVSKNLRWWLVHVPFLSVVGWQQAVAYSFGLGAVNVIYFLRAKTEERMLMSDPAYREYSAWIAENGLWARIRQGLHRSIAFRGDAASQLS